MKTTYRPKLEDKVRVSLHGKVVKLTGHDGCMEVMTDTGFFHCIYPEDPGIVLLKQDNSIPPRQDDVWFMNGHVWHADANRSLVRVSVTANGRLAYTRAFETVLHSGTQEPELLFRYRV